MKIAVLTSSYPRFQGDGTAPFVKSIAEQMASLGHQVEVVAPYDPLVVRDTTNTVPVHRFRYAPVDQWHVMGHARALEADVRLKPLTYLLLPFFLLAAFLTLLRITARQKSQAIHVHWVIPNGPVAAIVAGLRGIPFMVSLHGSDMYLASRTGFMGRIFGAVASWVFRRASEVTACSPELRQAALKLGAPLDTHLIPWGANPQVFHPGKRSKALRQRSGWTDDEVVMIALGRLVHKKGFDRLVEAWRSVAEVNRKARLVIGGDGPLRKVLEDRVQQLGLASRITFLGRVPWDQVPELFASSDGFILPSVIDEHGNMDGLPTVLLEAMGSGLPVVASALGGIPLVIEDRQTGRLISPGDVQALSKALIEITGNQNERIRLGFAARRAVESRYNWEIVARQMVGMLERASWYTAQKTRMGSIYRDQMIRLLGRRSNQGRVLDVGCHDGLFLSTLSAPFRVGVDPEPKPGSPGVLFVRADGRFLPFIPGGFDSVYALDVIEHVADDQAFARTLLEALAPGGKLFLSTPSQEIRMFPRFLTGWISRSWGHDLRWGYTVERLQELFDFPGFEINVQPWNAPAYRFAYLPGRLGYALAPRLMRNLIRKIAGWDARRTEGQHGFWLLEASRREVDCLSDVPGVDE